MNAKGHFEGIKSLLEKGADPHHKNKHGRSPFDMAKTIANGLEEIFSDK